MTCRDNRDGSCTVEYLPTKAGDYDITVKFADQNIPGRVMRKCYTVYSMDAFTVHCGFVCTAGSLAGGERMVFQLFLVFYILVSHQWPQCFVCSVLCRYLW